MIVDGFLFNDELDMLELRLMELGDLVDRFVLVESPFDFQQNPKPLHYAENTESRFDRWRDKIRPLVAETPLGPHPVVEHEQRRWIQWGINDLELTDVIMIGDVDEIPSRKVLETLKRHAPAQPMVVRQQLYYYRVTNHAGLWNGTVVMARGLGKLDCQKIRDRRNFYEPLPIEPSGWHFSWFGDAEDVARKLGCIDVKGDNALYKSNLPDIPDSSDTTKIGRRVSLGDDLFGREMEFTDVRIAPGVNHPECIESWLEGKEKYGVDLSKV